MRSLPAHGGWNAGVRNLLLYAKLGRLSKRQQDILLPIANPHLILERLLHNSGRAGCPPTFILGVLHEARLPSTLVSR